MSPRDIHPRSKLLREMRASRLRHQQAQQEFLGAMLGAGAPRRLLDGGGTQMLAALAAPATRTTQLEHALATAQRTSTVLGIACIVLCALLLGS